MSTVLVPSSAEALAAIVAEAHKNGESILPMGQGSKGHWGPQVKCDRTVSSQGLDRLIDHAMGDLTVTVEAGMKLATLQGILAKEGQFLAIDPSYGETATLGGLIATADSGSLRHRYGGVRDMLLGVTFVRADGAIVKAGGRVVKNVAGYDLMKLMTGSFGTLGILTQVTMRLYPLPEVSQTMAIEGGDLGAIVAAIQSSTLTPTSLDLLSPRAAEKLGFSDKTLLVRFQSMAAGVASQVDHLQAIAPGKLIPDDRDLWKTLGTLGCAGNVVCKVGVRTVDAVALLDQLGAADELVLHAGAGLGRLVLPSPEAAAKLRAWLGDRQGFLTVLAGAGELEPWGYAGGALALMRSVKEKFDPRGVLSPGRFVGGI